jgi:hypothetical protein
MNSQVSCVSGYSSAAENTVIDVGIASPTLPALRGGGFSPGKKEAGGGAKNYLALGNSPSGKDGNGEKGEDGKVESTKFDATTRRNSNGHNRKETARVEIREDKSIKSSNRSIIAKDVMALRRGGTGRSRRNTVVERFEDDLNRARQALRESRGYNLQAASEDLEGPTSKKSLGPGGLMTHAPRLVQEEGSASPETLRLNDEKGALGSSMARKNLARRV